MKKLVASAIIALLFSTKGYACEKPSAPALPEAGSAVLAQMTKAQNEVKSYMAAAEAYLECLGGAKVEEHNAAIDEMEKLAEAFNSLIRDFKARMKS